MYSFNYLGCVPFTAAKLTKGGWFSLLVSSLYVYTPLASMEPLQHLHLVSLTVVNGIHTWLVNIHVYMYECVMYMCICVYVCVNVCIYK